MILCISVSCSWPNPFSASPFKSIFRVSGALHRARSSASFLKNSGSLPKSSSMNCCADMGVPFGCQNVVDTMCCMARSFPSASFTFAFLLHTHGRSPQSGQGSFAHSHGCLPQMGHGCGDAFTHWQG